MTLQDMTTIAISDLVPGASLVTTSSAFKGSLPVAPSIGDYNIDGYPDLLLLTSSGSSRNVNLFESRPCAATSCTAGEVAKGRRAFQRVVLGAEVLSTINDVETAHWLDIDDDVSHLLRFRSTLDLSTHGVVTWTGLVGYYGPAYRQYWSCETRDVHQKQLLSRRLFPQSFG